MSIYKSPGVDSVSFTYFLDNLQLGWLHITTGTNTNTVKITACVFYHNGKLFWSLFSSTQFSIYYSDVQPVRNKIVM